MPNTLIAQVVVLQVDLSNLAWVTLDKTHQVLSEVDSNVAIDDVYLTIDALLLAYILESLELIPILDVDVASLPQSD